MINKVFSKEYLIEELDLPSSSIIDKVIDTTRWSVIHEIVFEDNGKFYQTTYSVGQLKCNMRDLGNMLMKSNVQRLNYVK